jgi:hypothetical protein
MLFGDTERKSGMAPTCFSVEGTVLPGLFSIASDIFRYPDQHKRSDSVKLKRDGVTISRIRLLETTRMQPASGPGQTG